VRLRYLGRLILSNILTESPNLRQCGILLCQGIALIGLDSDHALGARHLHCGIGSVDIVVPDVEAGHLEWQHHPALVAPLSHRTPLGRCVRWVWMSTLG
jgi:hypothetical protein